MKRNYTSVLTLSLILLFSTGCATKQSELTQNEIFKKYDSISTLQKNLQSTQEKEVDIFAPQGYAKAKVLFDQSFSLAKENSESKSLEKAKQGLIILARAQSNAKQAKEVMRDVIINRDLAIQSKAPALFPEKFSKIEMRLKNANNFIADGAIEKAKQFRPELLEAYANLQIKALKKGVVDFAKSSSSIARENDADDYAPKTLASADKELALALSILQTDRTKTEVANHRAKIADLNYRKANRISDILKTLERRESTKEDMILWYWTQLEAINAPIGTELDFTQKNHLLLASLKGKVSQLVSSLKDSKMLTEKLQDRIVKIQADYAVEIKKIQNSSKMKLTVLQKKQAEKERREKKLNERYTFISSLFTPQEATVYQKGSNVLISANGFDFEVGKAMIEAVNFRLLNKILMSIKQFPDSLIEVSGHTDSTGGEKINLQISKKRAENVAKFLINIGNINPDRITHEGFGESKPVAGNMLKEGRAKNRRIDLYIINKK